MTGLFHEAERGRGVGGGDGGAGHVKQLPLPENKPCQLNLILMRNYNISNTSLLTSYSYQNLPFFLKSSSSTFVEKKGYDDQYHLSFCSFRDVGAAVTPPSKGKFSPACVR